MSAKMIIRHRGNSSLAGQTQEFDRDVVKLGRREGNDILFNVERDTLVSGFHAEIRSEGSGASIVDLGSRNGTYVNGMRIGVATPIGPNDRVTLGIDGPEMAVELAGAAPPTLMVGSGGGGYAQTGLGLQAPLPPMAASAQVYDPALAVGRAPPPIVDRPVSRVSQGQLPPSPHRSIGMNTLMGALDKSRRDERRRIVMIAVPALFLILVGVGIFVWMRSGVASVVNNSYTTTGPSAADWAAIFRKLEPSVYQVQSYKKINGQFFHSASGTAWSVKPGFLATNGHVAALLDDAGAEGYVIARRGDPKNDLRIVKAHVHPGYKQSAEINLFYKPYVPAEGGFLDLFQACDVSLLEINREDVAKQGPPIVLAPTDIVEAGASVAYVGFPAEGVTGNYQNPVAYNGAGTIDRVLGLVLDGAKPGSETYIQHSLNTVGGASGSPIVNEKGEVVAVNFAGDKQGHAEDGSRISVAGFKYAVPIKMVRELLDGTAEAKQKIRHEEWAKILGDAFAKGIAEPGAIIQWGAGHAAGQLKQTGAMPAAHKVRPVGEGLVVTGASPAIEQVPIPASGLYFLSICSDQPGHDVKVDVIDGDSVFPVNEAYTSDTEKIRLYYGVRPLPLKNITAGDKLQVRFTATKASKVAWRLYQEFDPAQADTTPAQPPRPAKPENPPNPLAPQNPTAPQNPLAPQNPPAPQNPLAPRNPLAPPG